MKKIAVINDLSGLGKCSLTAAIPVISVMGVQACPLPTAVLSNQTGYESYFCDDYTDRMDAIMEEWEKREFVPDGIYTGFLAGEAQAEKILEFFRKFREKDTLVLVDPVMGDNGTEYPIYSEGLCEKMRELASCAQVITPNLTEAMLLLYGKDGMDSRWESLKALSSEVYLEEIKGIASALVKKFRLTAAVITGIEYQPAGKPLLVGNLVMETKQYDWSFAPKAGGSYSGTGDIFASILSAGLVKGISMDACVKKAVDFLSKAIQDTLKDGTNRNDGVNFEKYLGDLLF